MQPITVSCLSNIIMLEQEKSQYCILYDLSNAIYTHIDLCYLSLIHQMFLICGSRHLFIARLQAVVSKVID